MSQFKKQFNVTLSFFLKLLSENKFVKSVKLLSLNAKPINPVQKYLHIIESYAGILL